MNERFASRKPTNIRHANEYDDESKPKHLQQNTSRKPGCLVWGALALTLQMSQIAGVAPLQMTRLHTGLIAQVKPSLRYYGYALLYVSLAGLITGLVMDIRLDKAHAVRTRAPAATFTWIAKVILITIISAIGVHNGPSRMRRIVEHVSDINKILIRLGNGLTWQPVETRKKVFAILITIAVNFTCILDVAKFILDAYKENKETTVACLYSCFIVVTLIVHYIMLQYVFVAWLVESALIRINVAVEDFVYIIDLQRPHISEKVGQSMRGAISAYSKTFNTLRQINETFDKTLVLLMMLFFLYLVITPYYLLSLLMSSSIKSLNVFIEFMYLILYIANVFIITEPGHRVEIQMRRTQQLVSQLLRRVRLEDPLSTELYLLYKLITLNKVNFSAGGLCILSRDLILSLFSSVITHIISILQFQSIDTNVW